MLMSIPNELYNYMDFRGKKPSIIKTAPDSVKEKAREVDKLVKEKTGESFFEEIRD